MRAVLQSEVIQVDDDPEALLALSLEQKWGDGLPLIPPTDERIDAMLSGTPRPSTEIVVQELPPRHGVASVELIAINAVMAGCQPKHLPLVIAALEAIDRPRYNGYGLGATTSSAAPMLIVNGPLRQDMEINVRAGCLGGATGRGSNTIGRAVQLCLRNIGGMRAGESTRSVFGQPARLGGLCFGEWEERSPWPSLACRRGFSPDQEVVTVHGGKGTVALADVQTDDDRELARLIAKSAAAPMNNLFMPLKTNGEVIVLLNPKWAERFGETFPQIESLQEFMFENAWQPIDFWPQSCRVYLEEGGRTDHRGRVHTFSRPDRIQPLVCGGLGGLHGTILPSWGESEMQSVATTRH